MLAAALVAVEALLVRVLLPLVLAGFAVGLGLVLCVCSKGQHERVVGVRAWCLCAQLRTCRIGLGLAMIEHCVWRAKIHPLVLLPPQSVGQSNVPSPRPRRPRRHCGL